MTLLVLRDLVKHYPSGRRGLLGRGGSAGVVQAVDGVSLNVDRGETVGLVGESGSGKSTLGRLALRLIEPTSGTVSFDGVDVTGLRGAELRRIRRRMQMVFQDPYSSMDPRAPIGRAVAEPLAVHEGVGGRAREARVRELLDLVDMAGADLGRLPHEFSGGQLQRVALARALALRPDLLVLDEPVSSLDVSTQAEVINLLERLQRELGVAYLLIAHDLSLVRHASRQIAVMYLGRLVEIGPANAVHTAPKHPYTEALLSAIPIPDPTVQRARRRIVLAGDPPSPVEPPPGCRFHTRCRYAMEVCRTVDPPAFAAGDGSVVHCHLHTAGPRLGGTSVLSLDTAVVAVERSP